MSQQLHTALRKEVSRKEFLGMSGLAIASLFGFGTLVKLLTGKSLGSHKYFGTGYGGSLYGGNKE